ncbi:DNA methyltransferase [Roseovarius sp. Pro17]|uniref:DNA methyltransferase n=1 Tax=Roseovarius sp. Pro17 TaxID=3108175 RepID=UPI002D76EBB3|nr:DNA methyltransferase [Roseovarius sp. Pro17]
MTKSTEPSGETLIDTKPRARSTPSSTVGRGKAITRAEPLKQDRWSDGQTTLIFGDSLVHYGDWDAPDCIVSDGAYGVLGFEGDTSDHTGMPEWYEPHIAAWSKQAKPSTSLWFWNSEIGWATVHPILERYGWRYVNANIWDKGIGHIAGNVNTKKIRRFPVVSEVCVQYVREPQMNGRHIKLWLLDEWKRTGLSVREANKACGVADAATRKYLDQGHLWYWMPSDKFRMLVEYANANGKPDGRPYFSQDGESPMTSDDWETTRSFFACPHGLTNVWSRPALRGPERIKTNGTSGRAVHLNQKPLDLMSRTIEATTREGDVVWEPFGGLFSASVAARRLKRRSFSAEIDPTYFHYGLDRITQ